jgi:hypothetical protein
MAAIQSQTGTIVEQNRQLDRKQDALMQMLDEQTRLFYDAVKSLEYVQIGANFAASFTMSLLKLDVVRLRLTRWGQSVGLQNVHDGDDVERLQVARLATEDREQVQDVLVQVLELFAEADGASKRLR